jgi:phosphate transport system permease protein
MAQTVLEPTAEPTDAGPPDTDPPRVLDVPRPLRARPQEDVLALVGSAIGSLALVWLVFEGLLPLSGTLGFVLCWFATFIVMYAGVTAVSHPRVVVVDRVATTFMWAAAIILAVALTTVVVYTFVQGWAALTHWNFFRTDMSGVGPSDDLDRGGVLHVIIGSLIEVGIAVAVALPLGIGTAVYMSEVGGRFSHVVRTVVEAMTALPSIVAGLFIYTVLIVHFHVERSGFAASMAIAVMMLPIIARAADVVLRVTPGGLREASLALGATRWRTVWQIVLPTVRPGLATAVILGVARGVGETSPVLLTSGASTFFNTNPTKDPMNSLPLFVFSAVRSGDPTYIQRGFGAAAVLLALVLTLFAITRFLARPRAGHK